MDSKLIVSGIKWTSLQFLIETFFRFSIRLILAKLLLPEEFGLVGMSFVFISVAGAASELGMSAALIQKKDDSEAEVLYATSFWSGIGWGILIFCLLSFVVAPFVASFYKEPLLIKLVPILSLSILFKPLTMIHTVILTRRMNFKDIAKVNNGAALIAGIIALISAYYGSGVWSLAVNSVLSVGLTIPFLFVITKWSPTFEWKIDYFKEIFGFGAYSTGTGIFSTITYNVDNLLIGKLLGASVLGNYTLAFSLTEQLRQVISNVLNKVMYPVFGRVQDEKVKLRDFFLKIININAIIIYPLMAFLVIFGREVIVGFFGSKWESAVLPLQILALAMMVHLLVNSFTSLIRAIGKPKLEMKIIMGLTLFVLIPGLYLGIIYFGVVGAAVAILCNKVCLSVVGLLVLKKEIDLPLLKVLVAVRSALLGVFCSSAVVLSLIYFFKIKYLFVLSPLYIIIYIVIIYKLEKSNLKGILKNIL